VSNTDESTRRCSVASQLSDAAKRALMQWGGSSASVAKL
jgi:hypothetical protein